MRKNQRLKKTIRFLSLDASKPLISKIVCNYQLVVIDPSFVQSKHFDAVGKVLKSKLPKNCSFFLNSNLNQSITKKPLGSRIGKGKGPVLKKIKRINEGAVFLSFISPSLVLSQSINKGCSYKLPFKTLLVQKEKPF